MKLRDARKQASRQRVLQAARSLFMEIGFNETTVRMIAERAGVSPGGVFTTFEGKVAILSQIFAERRAVLIDELAAALPALTGSARERVAALAGKAHEAEYPQLKLVAAYIGASYDWSEALDEAHRRANRPMFELVLGVLQQGVDSGEIDAAADLPLMVDLIAAAYQRNYRGARYEGWDVAALNARMRGQLDLLFDGAASGRGSPPSS